MAGETSQGGLGSSPPAFRLLDRCKAVTGLQASREQMGDSLSRSLEATTVQKKQRADAEGTEGQGGVFLGRKKKSRNRRVSKGCTSLHQVWFSGDQDSFEEGQGQKQTSSLACDFLGGREKLRSL